VIRSDPVAVVSLVRVKALIPPAIAVILVGGIALGLGHSRGGARTTPSRGVATGATAHLTIANYAFAPPSLTVRAGTTITVTNTDATAHTATARSGAFDTGTLEPGHTVRFTLHRPGVYTYYCQFHAFMTGTITVVP
jgi:plastocyanin